MFFSDLRSKRSNREETAGHKEVVELINELRATMAASKEEMSNLIRELRVDLDTVKKERMNPRIDESIRTSLTQNNPSDSANIWSIRNIFTLSYLDGLRELADVNLNWVVKVAWFLILFVNLLLLAYGMRPIVKEYLEEVTITKVRQIEANFTQLNRPSICLTLLKDFLYLKNENGSRDDLHPIDNQSLLYLGHIKAMMPLFASSGLWLSDIPSENLTWRQFKSLPARSSYSISYETASLLSQNTLYDVLYYWGIGQTNLTTSEQSKFQHATTLYSELLMRETKGSAKKFIRISPLCLPIHLEENTWIAASEKQVQWFYYEHYASAERTTLSLVHQWRFYPFHFNTKPFSLISSYPYSNLDSMYRYKRDYTEYLVRPIKHIHLNLTRQPCYDALGEIYPLGFGETICFHDCLWKNHAILFNCSFWEDMNPDDQSNISACNVFDIFYQTRSNMSQMCEYNQNQPWCNDKIMRSVEEWSQLLMRTYRELMTEKVAVIGDCQSRCVNFTFCEEWELQYETLYKHDRVEFINDPIGPNSHSGLIANRAYAIPLFVSVNEDVLKATREEFMSSLGGIIGLYFGSSICGYLHLLLFLLISCCRRVIKMANNPLSDGGHLNT